MQQNRRHIVSIPKEGESFECSEDQMIWAAMWRFGSKAYKHSCFGGGCGNCKMRVLSGDVFVAKPMSRAHVDKSDVDEGVYLMCCIRPRGNVVLASI